MTVRLLERRENISRYVFSHGPNALLDQKPELGASNLSSPHRHSNNRPMPLYVVAQKTAISYTITHIMNYDAI